jgi:hypothetical protein
MIMIGGWGYSNQKPIMIMESLDLDAVGWPGSTEEEQ